MKRACVIGWPISHSRSPAIHNYWLKQYGIEGQYERVPVRPEDLWAFLRGLEQAGYVGCNVTLPHKEGAFRAVDKVDEIAARLGVVNTVYLRDGLLHGTSTDGEGFMASLAASVSGFSIANRKVALLGAGGSAKAVVGALLDAGAAQIAVVNRTAERAEALAAEFGPRLSALPWERANAAMQEASLLVNTTSLGMAGQPHLEIGIEELPADAVVADLIYIPLETPLLRKARDAGHRAVNGLGMLLHQAVRGFELWFGRRPIVTPELYGLIARDVESGSRS